MLADPAHRLVVGFGLAGGCTDIAARSGPPNLDGLIIESLFTRYLVVTFSPASRATHPSRDRRRTDAVAKSGAGWLPTPPHRNCWLRISSMLLSSVSQGPALRSGRTLSNGVDDRGTRGLVLVAVGPASCDGMLPSSP